MQLNYIPKNGQNGKFYIYTVEYYTVIEKNEILGLPWWSSG